MTRKIPAPKVAAEAPFKCDDFHHTGECWKCDLNFEYRRGQAVDESICCPDCGAGSMTMLYNYGRTIGRRYLCECRPIEPTNIKPTDHSRRKYQND